MRINRQIRAHEVRVIGPDGEQLGVMAVREAQMRAEDRSLDLVEIAPNASPPVCKIIDYGKFRYDQTKREKESKKSQHQVKVKEIKVKPNIDSHDLRTKLRHARDFLSKGNKVKLTCVFRGRELAHPEIGEKIMRAVVEELDDIAMAESPMKMFKRFLTVVLAPSTKNKNKATKQESTEERST